jgi:cyclic-di-GMP-binding protein
MMDVLAQKLAERGVDMGCVKDGKVEESDSKVRQTVTIRRGIDAELARKIVKMIKEKLKLLAVSRVTRCA